MRTLMAVFTRRARSVLPRGTALLAAALTTGSLAGVLAAGPAAAQPRAPAPEPGITPGIATITPADGGTPVADLAYTGTSGSVYVRDVFRPGQRVTALGGHLTSGPAVALTGIFSNGAAEQLAVFGRGADGALWWRHQRASGSWTSWQSLGGRLTSKPAVAATRGARGKLSVFVRGADSAIWYRTLGNGRWGGWTRLGGKLLPGTAPAAVYDYTGHLMAAAVGTDRAIRMFSNISGSRAAERGLGGQTTRDPAITAITSRHATEQAPAAYRAVVFIRGTDGTLRARQVSDPLTTLKGTWRSLGGRLTSGIAAHSDVAGTFTYVFALGASNQFQLRIGGWPALGPWTRA
jgi:hypothetical protein